MVESFSPRYIHGTRTKLFRLHAEVQAGAPFSVEVTAQAEHFVNLINKRVQEKRKLKIKKRKQEAQVSN